MKFSIRDLLLVTLIVGLALGWWVDTKQRIIREEALKKGKDIAETKFVLLQQIVERNGAKVEVEPPDQGGHFSMTVSPRETVR